ncbi:acyltransferase family protein, partial [Singulisphaera rosea]
RATRTRLGLSAHEKIDICRGLFAFFVVSAHVLDICRDLRPDAFRALPASLDRLIYLSLEHGIYWVMGFFVISGYCIHLSVERLGASGRFPLRTYLIARFTRILPLYYAALLFTVLTEVLMVGARPGVWPNGLSPLVFLAQVFIIQNFTETFGAFGPSWSITNEVAYYIFYGFLASRPLGRKMAPAPLGMVLCVVIATFMQILYTTIAHTPFVLGIGLLFGLGINWFLGALVASYSRTLLGYRVVRVFAHAWLPLLLGIIYLRCQHDLPNQIIFLACGVAFSLMLLRFLDEDHANPEVRTPARWSEFIRVLGLASYPTYLFHGPIIMLLGSLILRCGLVIDWRILWVVCTGVGIATGLALGLLVEGPTMTWRAAFLRRLK